MTVGRPTPGFARGPINYALQTCPEGYCPECEAELDECECPYLPTPPARTPVQREAAEAARHMGWVRHDQAVASNARLLAEWAARDEAADPQCPCGRNPKVPEGELCDECLAEQYDAWIESRLDR